MSQFALSARPRALSASSAENVLSAHFSEAQLSACRNAGFLPCSVFEYGESFFYDSDMMEYVAMSDVQRDYVESADLLAIEYDVKNLDEFIDYATDMGGNLTPVSGFYAFLANGVLMYEQGDADFDFALQAALDYVACEQEELRTPAIAMVHVECVAYQF